MAWLKIIHLIELSSAYTEVAICKISFVIKKSRHPNTWTGQRVV